MLHTFFKMKNLIGSLLFLLIWNVGFSQELSSDRNYNFAELFEQVKNETPVFLVTSFEIRKELFFIPDRFLIVFPLVEEKELLDFSKGTRQKNYTPVISFGNFYEKKPSFTFRSSYGQQGHGKHKILKGYDYCLRPIY